MNFTQLEKSLQLGGVAPDARRTIIESLRANTGEQEAPEVALVSTGAADLALRDVPGLDDLTRRAVLNALIAAGAVAGEIPRVSASARDAESIWIGPALATARRYGLPADGRHIPLHVVDDKLADVGIDERMRIKALLARAGVI